MNQHWELAYESGKTIVTFMSFGFLAYSVFAMGTENLNWLFPVTAWVPEPTLVVFWLVLWVVLFFTALFKNLWLFSVPTNLYLSYILLRFAGLV